MDEELEKLFEKFPSIASVVSFYFALRVMRIVLDTFRKEILENET